MTEWLIITSARLVVSESVFFSKIYPVCVITLFQFLDGCCYCWGCETKRDRAQCKSHFGPFSINIQQGRAQKDVEGFWLWQFLCNCLLSIHTYSIHQINGHCSLFRTFLLFIILSSDTFCFLPKKEKEKKNIFGHFNWFSRSVLIFDKLMIHARLRYTANALLTHWRLNRKYVVWICFFFSFILS